MSKKNQFKKLFESAEIESADAHPKSTEPDQDEQPSEETTQGTDPQNESMQPLSVEADSAEDASIQAEETAADMTEPVSAESESGPHPSKESSTDDILEDVRRSLIEEDESAQSQQQSRWWRRIARRGKRPETEQTPSPAEIDLPIADDLSHVIETPITKEEPEQEIDEIEDLIQMLDAENGEAPVELFVATETETIAEPQPEPEPEIDFDELKRQAFQPRATDEADESISDVRSIALEDGEEVLVEVETKPVDPMEERLQAVENAFKPYRRYIYSALALLGVAMVVVTSLILFNIYQQSQSAPVQEVSNLPYPTAVKLPGGWSFQLGKGALQDGRWEPRGAEWLQGTEVCRWVALPWSTQLEAVIRTLNPKDPIELTMSNNDKLVYEVYSVHQLTQAEMQELDSNSPCLLLILTQSETEERWVLTALP